MRVVDNVFLETLESHLEGLREKGTSKVIWKGPMPTTAKEPDPPGPRPRQQVTPPDVRVAEPPQPVLPPSPPPPDETKSVPPHSPLQVLRLKRAAECQDSLPAEKSRILLVMNAAELEEPNRSLFSDMLTAIGYRLDEAEYLEWDQQTPLAGQAERMLVMGNDALQATSTAGMDLQIVRGMWQQSPHGKLLSTFPPSYLQDNPAGKKAAWSDLQKLLKDLGLLLPEWTVRKLGKK